MKDLIRIGSQIALGTLTEPKQIKRDNRLMFLAIGTLLVAGTVYLYKKYKHEKN